MTNGTIKKLVSDRGFGFIAAEDGKEYFFHRDAVDNFDSLNGGEKVTFEVEPSPKGPRAKQVRLSQYSSNGSSAARIGAARCRTKRGVRPRQPLSVARVAGGECWSKSACASGHSRWCTVSAST